MATFIIIVFIAIVVAWGYYSVHDNMNDPYNPWYGYFISPKGKYGTSYVGYNHNKKRKVYIGYPKQDRNKERYSQNFARYYLKFPDCFERHPDWDYKKHKELLNKYGHYLVVKKMEEKENK